MRRIVVTGLALICVVALGSMAVTREPRSAVIDAANRTPTQVEVTNFPAVQAVSGGVNVGNLPAVQNVAGSVQVTNLPLDANGNLRVAGAVGGTAPASTQLEMRILQSDLILSRTAPILLPAGYRTMAISVYAVDATKANVNIFAVGFGSDTAPFVHYTVGDFQAFGEAIPLDTPYGSDWPQQRPDRVARYAIMGTHLQLRINASSAAGGSTPPPADAEYYVHLFLTQ